MEGSVVLFQLHQINFGTNKLFSNVSLQFVPGLAKANHNDI